jgi:glutaryl-CoA dehydrogenase
MYPIFAYGSEAQRQRFRLRSPVARQSVALASPSPTTVPTLPDADALEPLPVVTGQAPRCGFQSPIADVFVVWAKTDDGIIRGFILEKGMTGRRRRRSKASSARALVTGEIVLDDVFCPEDQMLPGVEGLAGPFGCLNNARRIACALGAAEICWHAARQYTRSQQFGRPLAANQLIQKKPPTCKPRLRWGCKVVFGWGGSRTKGRRHPRSPRS